MFLPWGNAELLFGFFTFYGNSDQKEVNSIHVKKREVLVFSPFFFKFLEASVEFRAPIDI